MTGMTIIHGGTTDAVSALIAGLEREFGMHAGRALADRFLAAEDSDFCWDARVEERFLGGYDSLDDEDIELDRVAILGQLDGNWFTGICIVDGEGHVHGMISQRHFASARAAKKAWAHGRDAVPAIDASRLLDRRRRSFPGSGKTNPG